MFRLQLPRLTFSFPGLFGRAFLGKPKTHQQQERTRKQQQTAPIEGEGVPDLWLRRQPNDDRVIKITGLQLPASIRLGG